MKEPIKLIRGKAVPLNRADVDTDQIMPATHMRRIERTGYGRFLFELWREDPAFVLNDPQYAGAPILIAGKNFGCGSSREHAPWALQDYGFKAIIAPSFADIFRGNAGNIGLAAVMLPQDLCERLIARAEKRPEAEIVIDLERQLVTFDGEAAALQIDPFARRCILEGMDLIDVTLKSLPAIEAYERRRPAYMPKTIAD